MHRIVLCLFCAFCAGFPLTATNYEATRNPETSHVPDTAAVFPERRELDIKRSILTFDLDYARIGLENNGWGFGVGYERLVIGHVSAKGGFGHMTFKTSEDGLYCTTVNISLLANWYPFYEDLNRLYIGLGSGTDFLNYFGAGVESEAEGDTIIYLESVLGWKEKLFPWLMIDLHAGYNLIVQEPENFPGFTRYGKAGFIPGLTVKLIFR